MTLKSIKRISKELNNNPKRYHDILKDFSWRSQVWPMGG